MNLRYPLIYCELKQKQPKFAVKRAFKSEILIGFLSKNFDWFED